MQLPLADVFSACLAAESPDPPGPATAWVAVARMGDWLPWLGQASALLSDDEQARVARKRRQQDREGLVLCYALHRLLLSAWSGGDAARLPVGRDADGRPLSGQAGVSTSLSHTRDAFALVVASDAAVGIDVEPAESAATLEEIAGQVCHPQELQRLAHLAGTARQAQLLKAWVRKEAYLKAVGVGLEWEMSGFVADPGACLPLDWTHPDGASVRLHELDLLQPTHEVALAVNPDLRLRLLHLQPAPDPAGSS